MLKDLMRPSTSRFSTVRKPKVEPVLAFWVQKNVKAWVKLQNPVIDGVFFWLGR
jgi:hypothetical protein